MTFPSLPHSRFAILGLDRRLTWNPQARLKRIELNRNYGLLRLLLSKNTKLTMDKKLTIYNMILNTTYAIEVWGSAKTYKDSSHPQRPQSDDPSSTDII